MADLAENEEGLGEWVGVGGVGVGVTLCDTRGAGGSLDQFIYVLTEPGWVGSATDLAAMLGLSQLQHDWRGLHAASISRILTQSWYNMAYVS